MKNLNKFRLRKVSFMLSLIIIAGSLSGPVFASQASASNEMSEAVEPSEMPDDIDATEKAEVTDDNTNPDGEIASEKEARGNSEESGKETVKDTRSKDESEETLDQSSLEDKADYENSLDDILSESSDSLETSGRGGETVITNFVDEDSNSADKMSFASNIEEPIVEEETIDLGCGEIWSLSYDYNIEEAEDARLEVEGDIGYYYVNDYPQSLTTNTAEYHFFSSYETSATVKEYDCNNNIKKIYHIVVSPRKTEFTLCVGTYIEDHFSSVDGTYSILYSSGNEDEIRWLRWYVEEYYNEYPIQSYTSYEVSTVVKGLKKGDYEYRLTIDGEHPSQILIFHVVDHSYVETNRDDPTCLEDGVSYKSCEICSDTIQESIPATGHIWKNDYTIDREATCTKEGSESIHCSVCGEIDEETVRAIPKKQHAYSDWTVTKEATCTEEGS